MRVRSTSKPCTNHPDCATQHWVILYHALRRVRHLLWVRSPSCTTCCSGSHSRCVDRSCSSALCVTCYGVRNQQRASLVRRCFDSVHEAHLCWEVSCLSLESIVVASDHVILLFLGDNTIQDENLHHEALTQNRCFCDKRQGLRSSSHPLQVTFDR